ncbi:MAG: DUF3488 and transglutaminase-like domain-containing protein [Nitrospirota bacterium]
MPILSALQVVTWCLLLSSLTILWVGGLLSPWLTAAGYGAIGVSAVRVRAGSRPWLSAETWQWLTVAALLWFVLEWVVLAEGLLSASLHLLLYVMLYKLLTLTRSRDYLHLYLIGFFQLLASTSAPAELPYGIIFACYVVLAPWTLMLYTLQLEAEQQVLASIGRPGGDGAGVLAPVIRWPFFMMTTGTAVGTFLLTLAIFFILPRMGSGFLQQGGGGEPVRLVGFSERVDLGTIGAVKLDSTVVMRVGLTISGVLPRHAFYWRGTAYDFYDGAGWQNRQRARAFVPRGGDGWFRLATPAARRASTGVTLRQEITLEPIESAVVFAAAEATAVGGRLAGLRIDGQSTLLLPAAPAARLRYEVHSVVPRLAEPDTRIMTADYRQPPAALLQLPDGSERLMRLAREIVGLDAGGAGPSPLPVLEQARRIEAYLQNNYRYTLDVKPPRQLSAIDDFLFEQKAGYCEYYATAMTLMLRGLGIPARLVSGFLQGEWNGFGNYFTVRQQDAHTWVEVYFPRSGWYPFDPTPSVEASGAGALSRARQFFDTLWISWDRYIMRYSVRDQVAAFREMRVQGAAWQTRSLRWMDAAKAHGAAAWEWAARRREWWLLAAAVGCFTVLVMRWWTQRHGDWPFGRGRALRPEQRRGRTFYAKLLRLLASRGVEKPPSMTALEFSRWAGPRLGTAAPAIDSLTRHYYRLRFGANALTISEQAEVNELLRGLKRELGSMVTASPPSGGPSPDPPAAAPTATRRPPSPERPAR